MNSIKVKLLSPEATLPTRNHEDDAGIDIYSNEDVFIPVGTTVVISTGVAMRVDSGYVGMVADRSSMATRGLKTGGGIIDAGYTGELSIILHNVTNRSGSQGATRGYVIAKGDKIAQLLIIPIATPNLREVYDLGASNRGGKGFGSSGR